MDAWLLLTPVWVPLAVWTVIAGSDYAFTLYGARQYHSILKEHIVLEGSFELTPAFQEDVDAQRRVSPRVLRAVLATNAALLAVWALSVMLLGMPLVFAFVAGGAILRSLGVHVRHIRNAALPWFIRRGEGLRGRVEYERWLLLRLSAVELLTLAGFFGLIAWVDGSWSFFGGAAFNLITGLQHWAMSDQARRREPAASTTA